MFNKEEKIRGKEVETIIGPSVKVKGDFSGQGDIIIDGIFEGSLKTAGGIYVGDKARIVANIDAKEGRIAGEVMGNIKLRGYLEIAATAKISGDVYAATLSVERGAIINGKLSMANEGAAAAKQ